MSNNDFGKLFLTDFRSIEKDITYDGSIKDELNYLLNIFEGKSDVSEKEIRNGLLKKRHIDHILKSAIIGAQREIDGSYCTKIQLDEKFPHFK